MKTCTGCRQEKDASEFSVRKASKDGLAPLCCQCKTRKDADYYVGNREKLIERARKWVAQNVESRKVIEARYRKAHRPQQNLRTQNYRARKRAASDGWSATIEWWNELVSRFEGRCAYCRQDRKLTLDHVVPLNRGGQHSPDNIVPACGGCNYTKRDQSLDELGWTCFVPSASVRERGAALMATRPGLSYQRAIREVIAASEGEMANAPQRMDGAYVTPISNEQAASIILKYEWLGTMGRPQACYGLWFDIDGQPTLAGAVCFGFATGVQAGHVCGKGLAHQAIALERGACVHWAPKNAASWFVPKAVALASKEHGWKIFYAYSDPEANEVGTIYQACNWIYLGIGPGHGPTRERWTRPDGVTVSSRALRYRRMKTSEALSLGWKKEVVAARGKYVWFEGSSRFKKAMRKLLVHAPVPYERRVALTEAPC